MAPTPFFMLSSFSDTGTIIFKKCLEFFVVVVVTFRVLFSSGVSFFVLFCSIFLCFLCALFSSGRPYLIAFYKKPLEPH